MIGTSDTSGRSVFDLRIVLFLALVANTLDLLATAVGIHGFSNREGNPLLARIAHHHWWLFVLVKGVLVPVLIVRLYTCRTSSPGLATAGMAIVTLALTVALGQWLGWMAGVLHVANLLNL